MNATEVSRKPQYVQSVPFFLLHVVALGVLFYPLAWKWVALCLTMYVIRMFGVTAGYHRYFSHRTYKLGRISQFFMAFLAQTSAQKGALWWAAHHRHHHRFSDQAQDIHSPVRDGFWWSHAGWILSDTYNETDWAGIQDLAKYPELRWLNRFHLVPPVLLGVAIYLVGGMPAYLWGFVVSTVLLWHGTFTINSLSHVFGRRRYETTDTSKNNGVLALITLGEGWHNNHHTYQSSTRQGFFWWEIDLTYYALKSLSWLGIVKGIRKPPLQQLEERRIRKPVRLRVLKGGAAVNEQVSPPHTHALI